MGTWYNTSSYQNISVLRQIISWDDIYGTKKKVFRYSRKFEFPTPSEK